jgi:hypothetical protein
MDSSESDFPKQDGPEWLSIENGFDEFTKSRS